MRKLSLGSKNERGAEALPGFTSVIQTSAKSRDCSLIDTLQNLFQFKVAGLPPKPTRRRAEPKAANQLHPGYMPVYPGAPAAPPELIPN